MKDININTILYNEFKKVEGKILKMKDKSNFWLVREVYRDGSSKARIKWDVWNKDKKKWEYAGCNDITKIQTEWDVFEKKELNKILILENLK